MITFRGGVLAVAAVFTFLLAWLTHVGWLYLLDAMLWGVLILSVAVPNLMVMSLSARRRITRHETTGSLGPSEGEAVRVELFMENGKSWPRYLLSISYLCPLAGPDDAQQRYFVTTMAARGPTILPSTVQCYRRGLHHFGPVHVESKAPFGLFRRRVRLEAPLSVLVYPQVHPMGSFPLLDGVQGTAARPRKVRAAQEIAGTRRYVSGDPLRHIHWKNTARAGRPMVKEFEDSQDDQLTIVFDSSVDLGEAPQSTLEYAIKLAASVSGYALGQGRKVRLLTGGLPDHELPWASLLRELAMLQVRQCPGVPAMADTIANGSKVVALISETDEQGIEALSRRAGHMAGMAVVIMQGFVEQRPGSGAEDLRKLGVPVVTCRQGQLVDALRGLERLEIAQGSGTSIAMAGRIS